MNKKIKRKWCAALRGGQWTQIRKRMRGDEPNHRCAVGVLEEVLDFRDDLYGGIIKQSAYNHVVRLNDTAAWSFEHIADWIEENL